MLPDFLFNDLVLNNDKTVLVGLSGGVDSSVAAYILKQQGYNVVGITMAIWDGKKLPPTSGGKHACYGPDEEEEIREAREIAGILNIPYEVFDCSAEYKKAVLDYFRNEYYEGRTPNPCIQCNQHIKFGLLPELARQKGFTFDFFATGHYARVELDAETGRYLLKKGADQKKDQTYFIYRLTQQQLSRAMLPVGIYTKTRIKEIAKEAGLPVYDKEESQDFYSGNYKDLLEQDAVSGNIVHTSGKVIGSHQGIWNYTIGQRKGMGIAWSEPLYVIRIEKETNTVIVGSREETFNTSFLVNDLNWIGIESLKAPMDASIKIRSAQKEKDALIEPFGEGLVKATFFHPNDSITPGQSAVFYDGDIVLGGGVIKNVIT
ncbi:MAG: tRNA 2-thiouridine(34) synthase MnmA [Bacteroidota bacterium]